VGLHSTNAHIQFLFKENEFAFKLNERILEEKKSAIQIIMQENVSHYDLHEIVHSYLYHNGYFETLMAFEKNANLQKQNIKLLKNDFAKSKAPKEKIHFSLPLQLPEKLPLDEIFLKKSSQPEIIQNSNEKPPVSQIILPQPSPILPKPSSFSSFKY